ncbi:MAG: RDD family protein [Candidatus Kerfeldbacteria bacterium]|nr:RDD family protein [Candidatus Kerfeldbacteria bacterium]
MESKTVQITPKPGEQKFQYAGFWIRFLACILDWVVLGIIGYILFGNEVTRIESGSISVRYTGWKNIIPFLYVLLFWLWLSATPGKLICRIKIIEIDGSKLSWQKALIRMFSYIPSALALFIGFIWAGFDSKKQAWHDKIAKTYVVKK